MLKTAAAAVSVLLAAASPAAHAQNAPASQTVGSAVDGNVITDVRIRVIKAALQLTPEQQKYWPAVEEAIRFRAKDRQERLARLRERDEKMHEPGLGESLGSPDPVEFLNRRAGALAQRSAGLKKLAGAWEPLYRTLDPDQKQRMRFVTMFLLAKVRDAAGQARDDEPDDE
jgi:hypothetical protein